MRLKSIEAKICGQTAAIFSQSCNEIIRSGRFLDCKSVRTDQFDSNLFTFLQLKDFDNCLR